MESLSLSRNSWGPRFWKILHTFAECSGNYTNPILSNDEADAWIVLIKIQRFVMPCELCRQHFFTWQKTHRFDHLRTLLGEDRKVWLRTWLWECHSAVNTANTKPSPTLEEVEALYPKQSIEKEVLELQSMFQLAFNKRQLKVEEVARWKLVVGRLRSMYSV
jgi:hypothetical protein